MSADDYDLRDVGDFRMEFNSASLFILIEKNICIVLNLFIVMHNMLFFCLVFIIGITLYFAIHFFLL